MESILRVFEQQGLIYRARSRVADQRLALYDWGTSRYFAANRAEFEDLCQKYAPGLRQGYRPGLEIREAGPGIGLGLFSRGSLAVGDLVGEYAGVIQASVDAPPDQLIDGHYLSDYAWNYPDELPDGTEFEINALKEGNELRFANHSSRPNMAVDHTLIDGLFVTFFRMIEAVAPGTQLTIDYGEEYWTGGFRQQRDL